MTVSLATIIKKLDAFISSDESTNVNLLYEALDGLQGLDMKTRKQAVPAMFALIERNPEAELGLPGPLVHELEAISGFESSLWDSVRKQPTELTVWMVNRLLNSELPHNERKAWMSALQKIQSNIHSPDKVREIASEFLHYQRERKE